MQSLLCHVQSRNSSTDMKTSVTYFISNEVSRNCEAQKKQKENFMSILSSSQSLRPSSLACIQTLAPELGIYSN